MITVLAQNLIEEISGLLILVRGERLTNLEQKVLQDESIETLTHMRNQLLLDDVIGIIITEED